MAEVVEVGAGDEVAATHHTLTRRCSSAGDIRSMSPHQSPYQPTKVHRTSLYESLTTPIRPGGARKTATAVSARQRCGERAQHFISNFFNVFVLMFVICFLF